MMKKRIICLSIVIILCVSLGFFIKNRFFDDHGKKKLIEEYNIHCENGTHLDSEYHKPKWNQKMVDNDDFYTLDIFCVDDDGIMNGIFYKFQGNYILKKGEYIDGRKNGERLFHGGRYTSSYVNDIKEGQEIFYNEDGSIYSISIYSNNDLVKKTKYNEDGNVESVCNKDEPHLYTCTNYDKNGEILEITSNNWGY